MLDSYLRVATALIDECMAITDVEALVSITSGQQNWSRRSDKKVDSGVSFGSNGGQDGHNEEKDDRKRSNDQRSPTTEEAPPAKKHYSTIERIAREIRRLKSKRINNTGTSESEQSDTDASKQDLEHPHQRPEEEVRKTIRRLRSLGDLRSVSRLANAREGSTTPVPPVLPPHITGLATTSFG